MKLMVSIFVGRTNRWVDIIHLYPLPNGCMRKKITCIAAMNSNQKGLPTEIKEIKWRVENSWMACKIDCGEIIIN